jgi:cytochrome c oxidase cbb3-type subunit IV
MRDTTTYETLAHIAQTAGILLFMTGFLMIVGYALWPKNQAKFDKAARAPLNDE